MHAYVCRQGRPGLLLLTARMCHGVCARRRGRGSSDGRLGMGREGGGGGSFTGEQRV